MTTTPALPAPSRHQTTEERRTISQRFIQHAREELAKGNRLQAGEKAWGAVAQYLKIIGDNRGWHHTSHRNLEYIARQILDEYSDHDSAALAHSLSDVYRNGHKNFYDNHATDEEIAGVVDNTESLVLPVFETLVSLPPRPIRIINSGQRMRLRELTGNRELEIGDESPVGFSIRHRPPDSGGNGGDSNGQPLMPTGPTPVDNPPQEGGRELPIPRPGGGGQEPVPFTPVTQQEPPQPSLRASRPSPAPRQRVMAGARLVNHAPAPKPGATVKTKPAVRKKAHPYARLRSHIQRTQRGRRLPR